MNKLVKFINVEGKVSFQALPVECDFNGLIKLSESAGFKVKVFDRGVPFTELPQTIINKAKSILKAFDEVNVTYYNDEFHVSAGYGICSHYPSDWFVCGYYKAEDIYTSEERKQNFIEEFGYAHIYFK